MKNVLLPRIHFFLVAALLTLAPTLVFASVEIVKDPPPPGSFWNSDTQNWEIREEWPPKPPKKNPKPSNNGPKAEAPKPQPQQPPQKTPKPSPQGPKAEVPKTQPKPKPEQPKPKADPKPKPEQPKVKPKPEQPKSKPVEQPKTPAPPKPVEQPKVAEQPKPVEQPKTEPSGPGSKGVAKLDTPTAPTLPSMPSAPQQPKADTTPPPEQAKSKPISPKALAVEKFSAVLEGVLKAGEGKGTLPSKGVIDALTALEHLSRGIVTISEKYKDLDDSHKLDEDVQKFLSESLSELQMLGTGSDLLAKDALDKLIEYLRVLQAGDGKRWLLEMGLSQTSGSLMKQNFCPWFLELMEKSPAEVKQAWPRADLIDCSEMATEKENEKPDPTPPKP